MNHFNRIYRLLWVLLIFLIMFLFYQDRTIETKEGTKQIISAFESSPYLSILTISLLLLLTLISVLRALEARNQWRKIGDEDKINQELDKIEKDKKIIWFSSIKGLIIIGKNVNLKTLNYWNKYNSRGGV